MVDNQDLVAHEAHDVYEHYDLADEDQIIAEMSGRVSDKYVYTFKQGGQDVTGLSFAGTNWAVREYAKQGEVIRVVGHPNIIADPTDPDYVIVMVTSQRFAVHKETGKEIPLDNAVGVKRQGKFTEKRKYGPDGELVGHEKVVDPFYIEKAVSKASRNSKQSLIPTETVKKLIARAVDSKNGKSVQGKGQPQGRPQQQQGGQPQGAPPQQQQAPPQARPIQPPPQAAPPVQQPPAQPVARPVQQAPPAVVAPAVQVAAPQPPPAQAPPPVVAPVQQAPAPVVQAPPPVAAPPPAAPAAAAPEVNKDVMVQKLDAVLKAIFATQDTNVSRRGLQVLTGYASPADMDVATIKSLGNVLNSVVKKQARVNLNQVVRLQDNAVIWQGPQIQAAPAAEPTDPDAPMF